MPKATFEAIQSCYMYQQKPDGVSLNRIKSFGSVLSSLNLLVCYLFNCVKLSTKKNQKKPKKKTQSFMYSVSKKDSFIS